MKTGGYAMGEVSQETRLYPASDAPRSLTESSRLSAVCACLAIAMLWASQAFSQTPGREQRKERRQTATESYPNLSLRLQNPLARVLVLPAVFEYAHGAGPMNNGESFRVGFEPRIPFSLNENWHLISQSRVAWVAQENVVEGSQEGLSDFTQTFFFSPDRSLGKGLFWGLGPTFVFPTASPDLLGARQFSVGPSVGIFMQRKPWTAGFIFNHVWSVAGTKTAPAVNVTTLQPLVAYTAPTSTTFLLRSRVNYIWQAEEWVVPVEVGIRQLTLIAGRPVQWGVGLSYFADSAVNTPEWGATFRLSFPLKSPRQAAQH